MALGLVKFCLQCLRIHLLRDSCIEAPLSLVQRIQLATQKRPLTSEVGALAAQLRNTLQGKTEQVIECAALELAAQFVLVPRGVDQPMGPEIHRDLGDLAAQHFAVHFHTHHVLLDALDQQQYGRGSRLGSLTGQKIVQRRIPGEHLQHTVGRRKQRGQALVITIAGTASSLHMRQGIDQRDHMIRGVQHRLAQQPAIAREGAQARVGTVDRPFDCHLDQRLGVPSRCFTCTEYRLKELQHAMPLRNRPSNNPSAVRARTRSQPELTTAGHGSGRR